MDDRRNYYRILHVQPEAPAEIIRASYRTLMQKLKAHPDLGGDHRQAALLNEAYAVLTDPVRREAYDRAFRERFRLPREIPVRDEAASRGATGRVILGCFFCGSPRPRGQTLRPDTLCLTCRSPLYPAARRSPAERERRLERLGREFHLVLFTEWPQSRGHPATCRDISPDGIRFVTAEPLSAHLLVKLESELCHAVVRVVNVRDNREQGDGRLLVGAEFVSVRFARSRGAFVSASA